MPTKPPVYLTILSTVCMSSSAAHWTEAVSRFALPLRAANAYERHALSRRCSSATRPGSDHRGKPGACRNETVLSSCGHSASTPESHKATVSSCAQSVLCPNHSFPPVPLISAGKSMPTRLAVNRTLSSSDMFMPGLYLHIQHQQAVLANSSSFCLPSALPVACHH